MDHRSYPDSQVEKAGVACLRHTRAVAPPNSWFENNEYWQEHGCSITKLSAFPLSLHGRKGT